MSPAEIEMGNVSIQFITLVLKNKNVLQMYNHGSVSCKEEKGVAQIVY